MSLRALQGPTGGGAPVGGSGTPDTIPRWTAASTLGDSLLSQSGNIVTNASGAIRATGTSQTSPAFMRHDATTSGIYFPATNEIGFTISNQHAMFISSGRLVGMGTTNPGGRLDVVGVAGLSWAIRAQVSSANTSPVLNAELGLNLKNTSATVGNYTSITNRDSSDNANTQINFINVNNSGSGAINFVTRDSVSGSAERARIDSSGNFILNTATTGATIQAAGSQQGLKLPATPGNADTQTLDCYQENTWTATDGSGAGLTFTVNNTAVYTRVGRLVHARIDITFPATANASNAQVNLPFASITYGGTTSCFVSGIGQVLAMSNGAGIEFYNAAGSRLTNANLSAARIVCAIVYQAS